MSFVVARCIGRLSGSRLCTSSTVTMLKTQTASITCVRDQPQEKRHSYKTFDYRRKNFNIIRQYIDRTHKRFDENSRVIIIDGPMASGKHEFGKRLAKQLDFKFIPQANVESHYNCDENGVFSYKDLDELLPESERIYDMKTFYEDKKAKVAEGGGRVGWLQYEWFAARLLTYNDAMLHLFSTGQGVVCVRSPWSDRVFAKALKDNGYLSKEGWKYYDKEIAINHLCDFPRPHLVIYLDADVETTKRNIQRRNKPLEVNTSVLTDGYLRSIENEYKDVVLPALESHGELLVYPSIPDITDHEVELMVEDIENLGPLEHSGLSDDHFLEDWSVMTDEELAFKRRMFTSMEFANKVFTHSKPWHAPEMNQDEYFATARGKLYNYTPGWQYEHGYDPEMVGLGTVLAGGNRAPKTTDIRFFWIPA